MKLLSFIQTVTKVNLHGVAVPSPDKVLNYIVNNGKFVILKFVLILPRIVSDIMKRLYALAKSIVVQT